MTPVLVLAAVSLVSAQTPSAANPACALLTSAQITSLIGAATAVPISATPMGSACMFNLEDKTLTVMIVNHTTMDGATRQFEINKRVVSGQPIPGFTLPSFEGTRPSAALMGYLKGQVFTDVKMGDPALSAEAVSVKLRAVLKAVAGQ